MTDNNVASVSFQTDFGGDKRWYIVSVDNDFRYSGPDKQMAMNVYDDIIAMLEY